VSADWLETSFSPSSSKRLPVPSRTIATKIDLKPLGGLLNNASSAEHIGRRTVASNSACRDRPAARMIELRCNNQASSAHGWSPTKSDGQDVLGQVVGLPAPSRVALIPP